MNVKSRVIALKFLEKQQKNPVYAKKIGIGVKITNNEKEEKNYEKSN